MDNDFATGYALGSDSNGGNCNNGGFWGGDGWWAIIIFAMIFGWGRGGFGGFGGGGASTDPGLQGLATRADVNEAIAFNGVERGISAIQQGICDSTYALNNASPAASTTPMLHFSRASMVFSLRCATWPLRHRTAAARPSALSTA